MTPPRLKPILADFKTSRRRLARLSLIAVVKIKARWELSPRWSKKRLGREPGAVLIDRKSIFAVFYR